MFLYLTLIDDLIRNNFVGFLRKKYYLIFATLSYIRSKSSTKTSNLFCYIHQMNLRGRDNPLLSNETIRQNLWEFHACELRDASLSYNRKLAKKGKWLFAVYCIKSAIFGRLCRCIVNNHFYGNTFSYLNVGLSRYCYFNLTTHNT